MNQYNNLWYQIHNIFITSAKKIQIFEGDTAKGEKAIKTLKITPNSALGSILFNTSGIIIDNWIRILGHEGTEGYGVLSFNMIDENGMAKKTDGMLVVANDVVGGMFALNTGKYTDGRGKIWYFAPDTLEWENMEMEYSEFLAWSVQGNTDQFYSSMRWEHWQEQCENVKFTEGILIYPFLWSEEVNIETAEKNIVPFDELFQLNLEFREKFGID